MFVVYLSMSGARNTMGTRGSDTRDLWRHWWEGPYDPSVGEGTGRWERLPPTDIKSHEGKAMSYA